MVGGAAAHGRREDSEGKVGFLDFEIWSELTVGLAFGDASNRIRRIAHIQYSPSFLQSEMRLSEHYL